MLRVYHAAEWLIVAGVVGTLAFMSSEQLAGALKVPLTLFMDLLRHRSIDRAVLLIDRAIKA